MSDDKLAKLYPDKQEEKAQTLILISLGLVYSDLLPYTA